MKTASLPLVLFSVACAFGTARAGVRVEVDPGAPFTEADLADAVDIRTPEVDGGGEEVVVRVAKLGMDKLVVIVGDRSQIVTLTDHDRTASSRVVALVVTALVDGDGPRAARPAVGPAAESDELIAPELAPPPAPGAPAGSAWLVGTTIGRDDGGYWIPFVHLGAARGVTPNARIVGTIGFAQFDGYLDSRTTLIPLRVGIEGHAGAAAIEIGGEITNYRETSCGGAEWGHASGLYGAAKIFLPVGARTRIVTELGGHFVGSISPTMCRSEPNYTEYGGWLGAGLEWAR